jgi:peptide-methionine (R)-S-oxide reductase
VNVRTTREAGRWVVAAAGCGFLIASQSLTHAREPHARKEEASLTMSNKIVKTEAQWRKELTPDQYRVLREKGTERAFTGRFWNTKDPGTYRCAACGQPLFESGTKFDSGCGWPSFTAPTPGAVEERSDRSHGMVRTEVLCSRCGGHLGHVFEDGPAPTGLRYCINSASLQLEPRKREPADQSPGNKGVTNPPPSKTGS